MDTTVNRSYMTMTTRKSASKAGQLQKTFSPDNSTLSPDTALNNSSSRSFILNSSMNGGKRQKLNDRFDDVSILDDNIVLSPPRKTTQVLV